MLGGTSRRQAAQDRPARCIDLTHGSVADIADVDSGSVPFRHRVVRCRPGGQLLVHPVPVYVHHANASPSGVGEDCKAPVRRH